MDVFVSYRRSDSEHLAGLIADRLTTLLPMSRVFMDQTTISAGSDFRSAIEAHLVQSDVVIAVVGAHWEGSGRISADGDYVRHELVRAHELGARVIPVLHSRSSMPDAGNLPDDLVWFSFRQAVQFGGFGELATDIERLRSLIVATPPELADLQSTAWEHYVRGESTQALDFVDKAWKTHGDRPSAALADCCRIAALVLTSQGRVVERNRWLVRAISTAALSGSLNVLASSMLPFFFQLSAEGLHAEARDVLTEIRRLIDPDTSGFPPPSMMRRMYHEKLAWSLAQSGDLPGAVAEYDKAISLSGEDERGRWKAIGGRALCQFRLGRTSEAEESTERVVIAATENAWEAIRAAAMKNILIMRGLDSAEFQPYEVT